jgi:Protein phosphatase 2C
MRTALHIFWAPKRGNTSEEYEDAFWPPESLDLHSKLLRFAIADGATETSFAGSWAQILTRAYCRDRLSQKKINRSLPRLREEWCSSIATQSLPWYAEQKLNEGAFATLLGLTLLDGSWKSTSIGDSCLFQLRGNAVITAFPMTSWQDFDNRPPLLSSNKRNWSKELAHLSYASGAWEKSDVFYLMTDAMACWFLRCVQEGRQPAEFLDRHEQFDEWVESLRDQGMRNDDVTLLRISVH